MINITPLDFSYTLLLCLGLWTDHTMPSSATLLSPSPLPFESPVCRHVLWSVPYHSRTLKGLQLFSTTFHVCSEICVANTLHLEKAMAPHSSTHAWKIPWMKEPGGLQSNGVAKSRTRLSDFTFTFHCHALEKEMATHSSVLAWRIPGRGEPDGLPSMG